MSREISEEHLSSGIMHASLSLKKAQNIWAASNKETLD